jgi:hypothetical protein
VEIEEARKCLDATPRQTVRIGRSIRIAVHTDGRVNTLHRGVFRSCRDFARTIGTAAT